MLRLCMSAASTPLNLALRVAEPQGPPEEEPKGVEMEADFEGELHDVPEDPAADDADPEEGDDDRLEQVCLSRNANISHCNRIITSGRRRRLDRQADCFTVL